MKMKEIQVGSIGLRLVSDGPWSINTKYPEAWRGELAIHLKIDKSQLRIRWAYASRENDWRRVDTATHRNISPKWAKWFHYCSYYSGIRREFKVRVPWWPHIYFFGLYKYIRHLTIGHFQVSWLPTGY